ncbi:hypothetical protein OG288_12445 [Streptomyces tauricus]|uniref:Uncharacterized protein n=1 Tax=Streptomyces tauricus TaxID=68274 RepID=A0ABZ1JFL0_9ACTN|nr:hypothetical protein [Streptomyces tauricus]
MATKTRFSISMDPVLHAAVKKSSEALGLDVSAYVTAAVRRQMAEDEVVARRFAAIDAAIAATDSAPVPPGASVDITDEDVAAVRAGMAQALAAPEEHAA